MSSTTDMDRRRNEDHWSFDKRVPIALVLAILFHGGFAIWYFSNLDSRVAGLERGADKVAIKDDHDNADMLNVKDRVLKLEITLQNINVKLDEIKDLVKHK